MKAWITGTNPVVGFTEVVRAIHSTPAMPASTPEIRNASEITRFARTPDRRAVVKSWDAARIATPDRDLRMNVVSATSEIAPIEAVMIDSTPMRTEPSCTASSNSAGTGMPRERTDTACRKAPWISCATANDVNSSDTKLALRSGRKAIELHQHRREAGRRHADQRDDDEGQACSAWRPASSSR